MKRIKSEKLEAVRILSLEVNKAAPNSPQIVAMTTIDDSNYSHRINFLSGLGIEKKNLDTVDKSLQDIKDEFSSGGASESLKNLKNFVIDEWKKDGASNEDIKSKLLQLFKEYKIDESSQKDLLGALKENSSQEIASRSDGFGSLSQTTW